MLVKGDKRQQINPVSFYLDQDLTISNATEIISVNALAKTRSVEALLGEARISYKIVYKVIYNSENGICCHEESFEQTVSVKAAAIEPRSYLDLACSVIAIEYVGVSNLKLRSSIEAKGHVIVPMSFMIPESMENVYKKSTPVTVESIIPVKESEIIASGSFDLKENIDTILSHDTQIVIKSVSSATEIAVIKGECYTYITYLNSGSLNSRCISIPFSAEILAPGVKDGSNTYCQGVADSTTINLVNNSEVKIETVVAVKGFNIMQQEVEILSDVYSLKKELNVVNSEVYIEDNICLTWANEKISGSVRLEEEKKRIRSVLCVCPPTVGAINVINNNGLTVEGIVSVAIVYLNQEEKLENELIEIPYHFVLTKEFKCHSSLDAKAVVSSISARARHNDEIEVSGDICIEVYGSNEKTIRYISAIEEMGDITPCDTAITIYPIKKGQTIWDIAKDLLADEETIMEMNPNLKMPLVVGDKVIIYRQL